MPMLFTNPCQDIWQSRFLYGSSQDEERWYKTKNTVPKQVIFIKLALIIDYSLDYREFPIKYTISYQYDMKILETVPKWSSGQF